MKDEALKLALEALGLYQAAGFGNSTDSNKQHEAFYKAQIAITAIKQALAIDKKAENARELGLDYEPVHEPVGKYTGETWDGSIISLYDDIPVGTLLYTTPPAQPTYDQTALELCKTCGWKTLIPGDVCLNCEHEAAIKQARKTPVQEPVAWISHNAGLYHFKPDESLDPLPLYHFTLTPPAAQPCPTCEALARTVMMDQTGRDA
jgi:ribosomal protein L32